MTELEFEKWYEGRKSMQDEVIDMLRDIIRKDKEIFKYKIISLDSIIERIESIDISKGYKVEE